MEIESTILFTEKLGYGQGIKERWICEDIRGKRILSLDMCREYETETYTVYNYRV